LYLDFITRRNGQQTSLKRQSIIHIQYQRIKLVVVVVVVVVGVVEASA
jgi:hypothetical protein